MAESARKFAEKHNYGYHNPEQSHKPGHYFCLCGWEGPDRRSYWTHLADLIESRDAELVREAERAARATAYELAAIECHRHANFCKHEAENGGDRDHLMARYAEANWNAQRIRSFITALDGAAVTFAQAEYRGKLLAPIEALAGKWNALAKWYADNHCSPSGHTETEIDIKKICATELLAAIEKVKEER
jgi:hypothetical protein